MSQGQKWSADAAEVGYFSRLLSPEIVCTSVQVLWFSAGHPMISPVAPVAVSPVMWCIGLTYLKMYQPHILK